LRLMMNSNFVDCTAESSQRRYPRGGQPDGEETNHRHSVLLRACRERPCHCRAAEQRYELAPPHVEHGASFPSVAFLVAGRATRWPSGWNVDRQKHDYEDQDRIKRDFRDVEAPTPPLLYSLLVHGRSPSVANRSITAGSACHRTAGQVLGANLKCSESRWVPTVFRASEGRIAEGTVAGDRWWKISVRPMTALGHVWTAPPWQELSDVFVALVGCGHVSGLFVRR
jgi:hypothetical protein